MEETTRLRRAISLAGFTPSIQNDSRSIAMNFEYFRYAVLYANSRPKHSMRHPQTDLLIVEALTWMADCYPPGETRERCWALAEEIAAEHGLTVDDAIYQRDI